MSEVKHLVNDLIDEDEILSDCFFREHSKVVSKDLHAAVKGVKHKRGTHIVLGRDNKKHTTLLREEVINTIYVLGMK